MVGWWHTCVGGEWVAMHGSGVQVVVEAAQGMARWQTIHDGNRQWVRTHFSGLLGDGSSPRAQRGEAPPPRSGAFRNF